jgi:hypothetical protein
MRLALCRIQLYYAYSLERFPALNRSSIALIKFSSTKTNIVLKVLASILLHKAFGKCLRVAQHSDERRTIVYTYNREYVLYLLKIQLAYQ